MANLNSNYGGLALKNPFIAAASPLTSDLASAKQLQSGGAAAVVLPSLFEEMIEQDAKHLEQYLGKIQSYKDALDIPVLGSLNGVTESGWLENALQLEQAGCDAIELNIYYIAADAAQSSDQIERRYIDLVYKLRAQVKIPIMVKLTSQFSSIAHLVKRLEDTGVNGVVLFNRFYLPDIDLDTLSVTPTLSLSQSQESLLRIRWIAILREQVRLSLCATGGIHSVQDTAKALLAGADAVQLCSVLFQQGVDELPRLLSGLDQWIEESPFSCVTDLKGKLSYGNVSDRSGYERQNYLQVLQANDS
ncbi:MAG: dihydroorotate dehydrogenase-like protein [Pseudomonadales bacterium]|nr:dihydroorotate dehydrogenase-like protein [Pseudomonadales bacterium]